MEHEEDLLKPDEVAQMFGVNVKTVTRWNNSGQLPAIKTVGGHRRYRRKDVQKALEDIWPDEVFK